MTNSNNVQRSAQDHQSGFIYMMDPGSARRQFHLSLIVIVALVMAIATAVLNVRGLTPTHPGYTAFLPTHMTPAQRDIGSEG